ncbi:SRPBCC domain-containing protein [Xanthobacter sp. KR7-225]|uniref:SRPBCC domain-containing protein n=1 Tax=Xanthobacter sp. KR7-225 TaxID=3156613 RepID=UPI0032B5814D
MSVKAGSGEAWTSKTRSRIPADRPSLDEMAAEARARPGTLRLAPRGDQEILIARAFAAPATALFRAWTDAAVARQWLGGPDFAILEAAVDPVPGGAYRYVLGDRQGRVMSWGGTFTAVEPGRALRATEWSDPAWYPGETRLALELREAAGETVALLTLGYESFTARTQVLRSPMDHGLAAAFDRLAALLAR